MKPAVGGGKYINHEREAKERHRVGVLQRISLIFPYLIPLAFPLSALVPFMK